MILQYLGTAAAEGFPGLFCSCDACARARASGGRNIRTRSQAVIDNCLLIDFPADTNMHILNYGLDLTKIYSVLITHCHEDHLYPADFAMRNRGLAHMKNESVLTIYGTKPTLETIRRSFDVMHLRKEDRLAFQAVKVFEPFQVERYTVTPLAANHDKRCMPVIYLIDDGVKRLLYAHDSGTFPEETWTFFKEHKPPLDFVSLDCTEGIKPTEFDGHMDITADAEVMKKLRSFGCAGSKTVFCASHFSHNGMATYNEMVPIAEEYGFLTAYDGMKVII